MVLIFVTAAPGAGPIGAYIVCAALRAPNHTLTTATDLTSLLTSAGTLGAIVPEIEGLWSRGRRQLVESSDKEPCHLSIVVNTYALRQTIAS